MSNSYLYNFVIVVLLTTAYSTIIPLQSGLSDQTLLMAENKIIKADYVVNSGMPDGKIEKVYFSKKSWRSDRIKELNDYWATFARTAKAGDFDGMKAQYHEDAVVVKQDTTFAVSEAFRVRWKDEIMEVKDGKRENSLAFRFSKRIGNDSTAFEKGIFHYKSIETSTGKTLADSYMYFENLLVKVGGKWLTLMEYQKEKATLEDWESLK